MNELPPTQNIEDEIAKTLTAVAEQPPHTAFRRPPAPFLPTDGDRLRHAMRNADRHVDTQGLQIEAFVDQAIHARILMVRGGYSPGPRDAYVRKMVLDAINSIENGNSHTLDR